ncbi:TetR family transcriptional regulator C-terminal domain-containing protein [Amycolatopsis suaedae]|uniref:BetI-type transcriptional repressor C-terminal domain-containing protein n=1 Tax=Amycolatopsis suaedae TaxID=2510978 RepID=A0A4Q7J6J7_9PSEU|nr:hypothetical protein EWH70_14710 [Amycolatopsis suaedae]
METLRLSALLDGLTMRAVLQEDSATPELLHAALRRSLRALAGSGQPGRAPAADG